MPSNFEGRDASAASVFDSQIKGAFPMDQQPQPCYKRILLKLSGEALMGDDAFGINRAVLQRMVEEIRTAKLILKTLGLKKGGIEVVSCPTCGRTKIDLIGLANEVEKMVANIPLDIKVAVMGCVVNGPGEAKEADIGIAGGIGEGLLIKKGEIVKKVKEEELLETLRQELLNWKE